MFLILQMLYGGYQEFAEKHIDPRIDHYPLLGSPFKILTLTGVYVLFVKKWGPQLMRDRQPYNVKNVMLVYNALQVLGNAALLFATTNLLLTNPSYKDWGCMTIDRTRDVLDVNCCYLYFILKVVDYMDTVFMVLRKNFRQISFLHVYHHALMGLIMYAVTRFIGGGHIIMVGYINCFVHMIMYAYYFVSAFRPELKSSLWWKKHITQLQLLQFTLLLVHLVRPFLHGDCDEPKWLLGFVMLQNVIMIVMFTQFYYKAYCAKCVPKSKQPSLQKFE